MKLNPMNWQLSRRAFLIVGAHIGLLPVLPNKFLLALAETAQNKITVAFVVSEKEVNALRKLDTGIILGPEERYEDLSGDGPDPGFAPLVIMVGAVTLGYLSRVAFELWGNYKYSGLILDLRKDPLQVAENTNLPRGTLLIINKDGTTKVHTPETQSALEKILTQVLSS